MRLPGLIVVIFAFTACHAAMGERVPDQFGQFGVGYQRFDADADPDVELSTSIWYPSDVVASEAIYPWGDSRYESPFLGVHSGEIADGKFPVVILSHGATAWPEQFSYLAESLASHGYVVAAPQHSPDDTSNIPVLLDNLDYRVEELNTALDGVLARNDVPSDPLHGALDSERLVVGGYSLGLTTTSYAIEEGLAADGYLVIESGVNWTLQADAPVLHIGGGDMFATTVSRRTLAPNLHAIDIAGNEDLNAHHWSFSMQGCQFREQVLKWGLANGEDESEILEAVLPDSFWLGCMNGLIAPGEAQQRINEYSVAFLNSALKNNEEFFELYSNDEGSVTGDMWIKVVTKSGPFDEGLFGEGLGIVVTDPMGRSFGFDAAAQEHINDFDAGILGGIGDTVSNLDFGFKEDILVSGEYTLVASTADLVEDREYEIYVGTFSDRGGDGLFSRRLLASGVAGPSDTISPITFSIALNEGSMTCDFDDDGSCSIADIDALVASIVGGANAAMFDLDGDGNVTPLDLDQWRSRAGEQNGLASAYLGGDSNLDGAVDATDLNNLALNWRQSVSSWSDGDFTGDGQVDAGDLNVLALNWRESVSAAAAAQAVPEPASSIMGVLGIFAILRQHHVGTRCSNDNRAIR